MTKELDTIEGRNEILQPILDRLLYLPEEQKKEFVKVSFYRSDLFAGKRGR